MVCALIFICSCSKDADEDNKEIYYVRYVATSSSPLEYVSVYTDVGLRSFNLTSTEYTQTYGPVAKGFEAKIIVSVTSGSERTVEIYVCRGEEPFALKRSGNISATYVIDF